MATAADKPVFIDTNILVYADLVRSPFHQSATEQLNALRREETELWISRQVLREYLATMTRPQAYATEISRADLRNNIAYFTANFRMTEDGPEVTDHLLDLLDRFNVSGKQIHDANIVATMLTHGVNRLLTHNIGDFTRFAVLITLLPLG